MAFNFTTAVPTIRNWGSAANLRLQELDEAVQSTQAMISNIPGPGVQLITFANTDATLGVGGDLWEMRIVKSNANRYVWDPDTDTWLLCPNNIYAAAGNIPGAVTLIAGNTAIIAGALWRWDGTQWLDDITAQPGYYRRARFEISATGNDYIKLTGGRYHVDGIGVVYNTGTIDYQLTSLATGVWSYIYIDTSTLTGPGPITAANLTDSTTAWSASTSKGGQYNGEDRGVFAVYGTGATSHRKISHHDEMVYFYNGHITIAAAQTNTSYVARTLVIPANSRAAAIGLEAFYQSTAGYSKLSLDGVNDFIIIQQPGVSGASGLTWTIVPCNAAAQVYTKTTLAGSQTYLYENGYALPWGT